ncbi:hypothetical protein AMATHDRAFT_144203, partial [Amanita thiersii Skay4041]
WYHKVWEQDETKENFFTWLDHGGGRALSLNECPRNQLEKEVGTFSKIIYLDVLSFIA